MKKLISIIMVVAIMALSCLTLVGCNTKIERMDNTECVILQFSDIHLDNTENYSKRAFRTLDNLVEMVNPDMIVFTGDINYDTDKKGGTKDNMQCLKTLATKLESYKIPWTFTFGNHCPSGYATKAELAEYLTTLEYCFFERGPEDVFGEGNHYTIIRNKDGKALMTAYFLDSTGEQGGGHKFEDSQIEWYSDSVKSIALAENGNETDYLPSIAFFHIPPREMAEAFARASESSPARTHDFFEWRCKFQSIDSKDLVIYGWRGEDECPPDEDDNMIETMKLMGTKAIFVGHEHLNNYVVEEDGFRMTYTNTFDHKWYIPTRGATVINIKNDGTYTQRCMWRKMFDNIWRITDEF